MTGTVWKRAGRVYMLALVIMVVVAFAGIVTLARELSGVTEGTVQYALLGLTMFVGTRNGNVSTLQPQIGLLLVLVIPLLAAGLTVVISLPGSRRKTNE